MLSWSEKLTFQNQRDDLVPVIVQDASTKVVLMLGFMNLRSPPGNYRHQAGNFL